MGPTRQDGAAAPLTFGIELEFLYISHGATVEEKYNHITSSSFDAQGGDQVDMRDGEDTCLKEVANIIRDQGLSVRAVALTTKNQEYDSWMLTHERHSHPHDLEERVGTERMSKILQHETGNRITAPNDDFRHQWNSEGLELVSRILKAPQNGQSDHESLQEVQKYLDALSSYDDRETFCFLGLPETGSVHVHVGLDPSSKQTFDLKVLQHLAYVLVVYEDLISLLHHPERRGFHKTKSDDAAESNRFWYGKHRHRCGKLYAFDEHRAWKRIFETSSANVLATLLDASRFDSGGWDHIHCDRRKYVNFENLRDKLPTNDDLSGLKSATAAMSLTGNRKKPKESTSNSAGVPTNKATVEFRQHAGTLDATAITQWILFVVALVRAAEKMANTETPSNASFPPVPSPSTLNHPRRGQYLKYAFSEPDRRMRELFDLLELNHAQRKYWWAKAKSYRTPELTSFATYMKCPECIQERDMNNQEESLDIPTLLANATDTTSHTKWWRNEHVPFTPDSDVPPPDKDNGGWYGGWSGEGDGKSAGNHAGDDAFDDAFDHDHEASGEFFDGDDSPGDAEEPGAHSEHGSESRAGETIGSHKSSAQEVGGASRVSPWKQIVETTTAKASMRIRRKEKLLRLAQAGKIDRSGKSKRRARKPQCWAEAYLRAFLGV